MNRRNFIKNVKKECIKHEVAIRNIIMVILIIMSFIGGFFVATKNLIEKTLNEVMFKFYGFYVIVAICSIVLFIIIFLILDMIYKKIHKEDPME